MRRILTPAASPSVKEVTVPVPTPAAACPDTAAILTDIGGVAFIWDIATDAMSWSGEPGVLFTVPAKALTTGAELACLIDAAPGIRTEALARARNGGDGSYRIAYGVRARVAASVSWIEEIGRWSATPGGQGRVHGLIRLDNERHAHDLQLEKHAELDPLTGELNRLHLLKRLADAIADAHQFRIQSVLMLIGVDHLARINDGFGFDVADEVISEVSRRVRGLLRGGDVIGRFSGNKIGVILKNCSNQDAEVAAERFLKGIRDDVISTTSSPVSATASIGAVSLPRYGRTIVDATSRALEAMELVKRRRHGSYAMWQPNAEREARRLMNRRVTENVVAALDEHRIILAFEPVVATITRAVAFHECLVRVRQTDGELLTPSHLLPVAERLGMIRLVDRRVLELVLAELTTTPDIHLSLNISPESMLDADWWLFLEAMLRNNPGVAERLIVEITETVAIQDLDDVCGFVARVKNLGGRIAIDDFGAGYTSFSSLRKLGVDIVKIDGAFVHHLATSADDQAFVQTMIDLCRRLGIRTVAEWVQDDASAMLLASWGCDYFQGRLVGLASVQHPWPAKPAGV